jgi:DNA-binding MarR family transcriptional regulator
MSEPPDTMIEITDAFDHVYRLMRSRRMHNALAARSGIKLERSGYSILASLGEEGAQRLTDLADQFGLDQSTVSRRVSTLERDGLIMRRPDKNDGRVALVSLTAAGRRALRQHHEAVVAVHGEILTGWTQTEKRALARAITAYAEAFSNSPLLRG